VIVPPEPDLEFFDASYLPNDKVVAVSNIGYQAVPCVSGGDAVGNLVLSDPQTGNLRRLTFDQDANWGPTVLNNGRLMYVRWEYTDLTHYFSRIVMHMNPDGTEQRALYGSGSVFPTATFDVQPVPGHPTRFVGIISGHHGVVRSGRLIIFDPAISRHEEKVWFRKSLSVTVLLFQLSKITWLMVFIPSLSNPIRLMKSTFWLQPNHPNQFVGFVSG
jgi:hypothetical protein